MSEKPTETSPFDRQISRRELLETAGKLGAGALIAGTLAGPAAAAARRVNIAKKVPLGGSIIWGQDVDPAHIAPFGGILTANHQGNELIYDSFLEWDPKLNVRNALIESYQVVNSKRDRLDAQEGPQVLERPGADCGRREVLVRPAGKSAPSGQRCDPHPVPGHRLDDGDLEVQAPDGSEDAGCPSLRVPRLGPLLVDRAERHVPDARPGG